MSKQELKQAKQFIAKAQYDEALDVVNLVLEYEKDCVPALLIKGVALQRKAAYKDSLEALQALLKLEPKNVMAWRAVAAVHIAEKNLAGIYESSMQALYYTITDSAKASEAEAARQKELMQGIYSGMKKSLARGNGPPFEAFVELQADLPDDALCGAKLDRRSVVHNALREAGIITTSNAVDALRRLVSLRAEQFEKQQKSIFQRQKSTINFSLENALAERKKLLDSLKLVRLVSLHIEREDEDDLRRKSEALLLEYLSTDLKDEIKLNSTQYAADIARLQTEVHDLVDRMAMFAPVQPLALELAWDYECVDLEEVIKELTSLGKARQNSAKDVKDAKDAKDAKDTKDTPNKGSKEPSEQSEHSKKQGEKHGKKKGKRGKPDEKEEGFKDSKFAYFIETFPNSALAKVFDFYVQGRSSRATSTKSLVAYHGDSVLGWALVAKEFAEQRMYQEGIDAALSGLRAVDIRARVYGMKLDKYKPFFKLVLAQVYTHHDAPKNWELAIENFDFVLNRADLAEHARFTALLGKGSLLAKMGEQDEALASLEEAVKLEPHNPQALSDVSWLYILRGDRDRGIEGLKRSISITNVAPVNAEMNWRIGYAIWTSPRSEEERETCYEYFVKALEFNANYAPAYTYLGLFYDELVGDKERAHRCFYNALEHDNGEVIAGEKLATDFAANSQWDLVEAVANTVLASTRARSMKNLDWPYRALGITRLNQLKYADAVKYFQRCLRSASEDVLAWIGLGESYIYSGRYRSAEKALGRALKLQPQNFSAWYVLSLAQRDMLQFPQSAASLRNAIKHAPEFSLALQWAMTDNSLRAAEFFFERGLRGDALVELSTGCEAIFAAFANSANANSEASNDASSDAEQLSVFFASAAEICHQIERLGYKSFSEVPADVFDLDAVADQFSKYMLPGFDVDASVISLAVEFASEFVTRTATDKKPRRVSAHFIAARSYEKAKDLELAAEHYKAAIQLEPRNAALWNAYGVCLTHVNPEVAQHCFIRSLSLNGRNEETWVNLAALYLVVKDYELSLEAADHALSLEPEHARAWIVQVLAEQALGTRTNDHLYRTLLYAYDLSNNDSIASFALAIKEFELRPETPSPAALGALEKLMALQTSSKTAHLILGLFLERAGLYEESLKHLLPLKAWAHIARVKFALQDYDGALEAVNLLLESDDSSAEDQLGVMLVSGLSHFFLGQLDAAIEFFTEALDVASQTREDVLRLLVEVLCASGDADAEQVAQEQLFGSIAEHGATLQVTLLLGALGFINKDSAVIQAAKDELEALMTPELQGEPLAQACRILSLLDPRSRSFQRAVFHWPTDYSLWRRVSPRQALVLAESQTRNPEQLSSALVEAGGDEDLSGDAKERVRNFQRAVFFDPVSEPAWQALAGGFAAEMA